MKNIINQLIWIISIIFTYQISFANDQQDIDQEIFPTNINYNIDIPTPASFLGRPLGAAPVRHHELVSYLQLVANLSNRLTIETIGFSHERRPILFVVATSESNQTKIDEIKKQHIALTEPASNQNIKKDMPVITWLNYGVHGAESSGMDASLPTIYHLAAAKGKEIDALLKNSVILITAVFNPDGHANRIAWLDTFGGQIPNSNPEHIEHNYDGRLTRTNHYGFDLNRQWISATQPEPRAWVTKWHEWRPNVSVDYHEMGSEQTYYFSPGVPTRNHPLIPKQGMELVAKVVKPSEAILDSQKRLYFHGDRYDHFFLGKGSSFPLVNGGVGILHEASSARGVKIDTRNGIRTYRENIIKHFRTSIANAQGAVNNKIELLNYQKEFYGNVPTRAAQHPIKAYILSAGKDKARLYHFIDLLNFHRINVYHLNNDVTLNQINYKRDETVIVPLNQSQHTLIRGMFDLAHEFEDSKFYDVSTWTLPLAYGLEYSEINDVNLSDKLLGQLVDNAKPSAPQPDQPEYAYAFEWSNYYSPKALYRILNSSLFTKVALNPFTASTSKGIYEFDRGSIIVSFDRQAVTPEKIHKLLQDVAKDHGIEIHALTSGRSVAGSKTPDVGSQFNKAIQKPTILLVAGRDMDWYNVGEIWHLLDQRMEIPVTISDRNLMQNTEFDRYTHIIFAGGKYKNYRPEFNKELAQWIRKGGTIIGIRQGADWIQNSLLDGDVKNDKAEQINNSDIRYAYAEKEGRDPLEFIGGTIFAGDLDITHPLGFGYSNKNIALHKNTTSILSRPKNPYGTVIAYKDSPILSGYASENNQRAIANTAALVAERYGNGSIILFADDPNFRATWYGTNKLFLNSLFFSLAFEQPR
ncbi:MAG: M14 family zinc carboxypeptidase [Woeseiaceae bacterium]|nr:M14 family zinc carboxypeptidase [Woeseiaceae bacterium]